MNKTVKIIIAVAVVVVAIIAILVAVFAFNSKPASNLSINSVEDLSTLVDQVYEGVSSEKPMLQTTTLDTSDLETFTSFTGLDNAENIEYAVISMPMMNAQAYQMVLVKVKDGADANAVAKTMNENVNERRWICVTANEIYAVSSGNVVCLVMSSNDLGLAQPVLDSFKTLAGSVGEVYERSVEEDIELPEEMY